MEHARKDDDGKDRWTLLPFKGLQQVVKVLGFGAKKYAPHAWRLVPNGRERYLDAAFRHLVAVSQGEELDAESGLPHLAHAVCCCLFALELA
jgi:hypothetical protein